MDETMIILRLVHIFSGSFWVGTDLLMMLVIVPAVAALGPTGGAFMQGMQKHTRYAQLMPLASLLTILSGVWLYTRVSDGFNRDWMESAAGLTLTIGATAGLLAFFDGLLLIGPTMKRLDAAQHRLMASNPHPQPEMVAELQRLKARGAFAMQSTTVLSVISLVGMASARYM